MASKVFGGGRILLILNAGHGKETHFEIGSFCADIGQMLRFIVHFSETELTT